MSVVKPRYLYKFVNGALSFFYTNVGSEKEFADDIYLADQVISHVAPERNQDPSKADVTIRVPFDNPVVALHGPHPAPLETKVTIYKFFQGVTEPTRDWGGTVVRPQYDGSFVNLLCRTRLSMLDIEGLSEDHGTLCNHFLGTGRCPVNLENFRQGISVDEIDGSVLTVTGITQIDGWFKGGKIRAPSNNDLRYIVEHIGDELTLDGPFPEETLAAGDTADIYPGCDRSIATCGTKYGAETGSGAAHGGITFMPSVNPHESGVVYV